MSKFLCLALMLICGIGLQAAPDGAEEGDEVGSIQRGGAEEGGTDTTLKGGGLSFKTDGFTLKMKTRIQLRLTYQNEVANGNDGTNGRDFVNFRVRRAKTAFSGHIFEKEFQYNVQLAWTDGDEIIENAWFRWAIDPHINITAGQAKLPWNWEEVSSSSRTLFADRSYVNEVFNQDYAKGLTIDGKVGEDVSWLKYWVGVYNGVLKDEDDFRNDDKPINGDEFAETVVDNEMMINLRLETHPLGDVKRSMYESRSEEEYDQPIFAIGLGLNWFTSGFDAAGAGVRGDNSGLGGTASGRFRTSQDTLALTADAHFRAFGLSVDLAFFYRKTEFHNRGANTFNPGGRADVGDITDTGFTAEISYFILPETFNIGLRYNHLDADDFWQGGSSSRAFGLRPDATEIGLAANYYIHGDTLKLTLDLLFVGQQLPLEAGGQSLDGVYNDPPGRVLGGGTLGSSEADHNDLWLIRLQLQWVF